LTIETVAITGGKNIKSTAHDRTAATAIARLLDIAGSPPSEVSQRIGRPAHIALTTTR
jgi:hypothetical protein